MAKRDVHVQIGEANEPLYYFCNAILITFGGTGAALSNCPKNLSAAGDVFRLQAHGLIGDQLDPVSDFDESSSLDSVCHFARRPIKLRSGSRHE
jgi:hypothetical protein